MVTDRRVSRDELRKISADYDILQTMFPEELFTDWLRRTDEPDVFHKKGRSSVAYLDLGKASCIRKMDKNLKKRCKKEGTKITE
jgi:hypothetical protein